MRRRAFVVMAALALCSAITVSAQNAPAPAPKPISIAGKWTMSLEMSQGTATPAIEFKQDGEKLTGTYTGRYGEFPLTGKVQERKIEFSFTMGAEGQQITLAFKGEVAADAQTMKGQASMGGELGDANWSAKRAPVK